MRSRPIQLNSAGRCRKPLLTDLRTMLSIFKRQFANQVGSIPLRRSRVFVLEVRYYMFVGSVKKMNVAALSRPQLIASEEVHAASELVRSPEFEFLVACCSEPTASSQHQFNQL